MKSNVKAIVWTAMGLVVGGILIGVVVSSCAYSRQKYALFHAAQNGDLQNVRLLLSQGSPINLQVSESLEWTPLIVAISQHHTNVVDYLIKAGADVNIPDMNGRTPLMWLTFWGDECVPYVREAIAHGARLDAKDKRGMTIFDWADGNHPEPELMKALETARSEQRTNFQH